MTFNAAIPASTDLISQSQSQIQTNFSQSNTAFGVDHTAFDVVSNQGKHKKSTYVEQGADPATAANELALYSKDLSAITTLYLRKESNGTVIQMSGLDPIAASTGTTFLPGGLILKWGTATGVGATIFTISFAGLGIGNFPNNIFNVQLSAYFAGTPQAYFLGPVGISTTGFQASVQGSSTIYWLAIGN